MILTTVAGVLWLFKLFLASSRNIPTSIQMKGFGHGNLLKVRVIFLFICPPSSVIPVNFLR